jgi:chromosome segregation ATPase
MEYELLQKLSIASPSARVSNGGSLTLMQNDRPARTVTQSINSHGTVRELVPLPATPSFALDEANSILDIEIQADQLLAYINKLTSLADRACSTAIRQNETTHLIEENRRSEMINLRNHLDQQSAQLHEQQLALIRLEHESKAKIASLETQLQQASFHRGEANKLEALRNENANLARRLHQAELLAKQAQSHIQGDLAPLNQEVAELRLQVANRDKMIQTKNNTIKTIELDYGAKIVELEQRLRDSETKLHELQTTIKEKDALIQATAGKEAEIGKLIKRLSTECDRLNTELQGKSHLPPQLEPKKAQSVTDSKIWRQVIGRFQEQSS